jgi:putative hydrolase of the HAD superfamily
MTITALAFDLDDTLFLERDYVRSAFQAVHQHMCDFIRNDVDWFDQLWHDFLQGVRGDAFNRVLEQAGIQPTPEIIRSLVRVYREHRPRISLLDDVLPALKMLDLPAAKLGIITDGPVMMQRRKFDALDLDSHIRHAIFTDAWGVGYRKPHPRAFETFEWLADAPPRNCAYVADNPLKDFRAPHARGWTTIRIVRQDALQAHLPNTAGEVDFQIDSLRDLPQTIDLARAEGNT